jgi:hypothetical protein
MFSLFYRFDNEILKIAENEVSMEVEVYLVHQDRWRLEQVFCVSSPQYCSCYCKRLLLLFPEDVPQFHNK